MRLLSWVIIGGTSLLVAAAGCGGSADGGPGGDAGSGGSAGSGGTAGSGGSGAGGGEPCGPSVCGAGLTCCNSSCGICTAPGEGCITLACEDAGGGGGSSGSGGSTFECGAQICKAGQQCCGAACGGLCADGELPCPDIDCPSPEPCGNTTCEPGFSCCNASCGTCVRPGEACDQGLCEPDCTPQDARGVGDCDGFFGVAWNGSQCLSVTGCECIGRDCNDLPFDGEECEKRYAECPQYFE